MRKMDPDPASVQIKTDPKVETLLKCIAQNF